MTEKSELGKAGENFACQYLVEKSFRLVERNARYPWGEIDIVMIAPDKTLVFVEVKTMKNFYQDGIKPEDQMTPAKIKKFKRTAMLYAGSHQNLINEKSGWRLDVIALTRIGKDFLVKHYENI